MKEKILKNKKIYIEGMTCISCEILITDELNGIKEIDNVTVCHRKQVADISYEEKEPEYEQIIDKIKGLGYNASLEPIKEKKQKTSPIQWIYSVLIVIGLYLIYKFLSLIGLFGWIDVDPTNITYGIAFLIGIVASMSTCLAIVGAVIISFAAKYQSKGNFYEANVKPHLLFHVGRLLTFFVLGGVLGVVGSWFNFSSSFMGWFTLLIAIILIWLGLNILGVLPSLSAAGIHMPRKAMNIWDRLKKSEHTLAPVILGGFTFFLPCGFTQSIQLFAMSSGSFWSGAMTLFLFALGTTPILLGIGVATTRFRNMRTVVFKKVIGFIVILFALYTVSTGFALIGVNFDFFGKKVVGSTTVQNNIQIIKMDITYQGFSPNIFKVKKGIPVKWIINGEQITGCSNEIIISSLNIRKKISSGENIINFTPEKAGIINFSCWMGMIRGKFIVEENISALNSAPAVYQDNSLNTTCSGGGACGGVCGNAGCGCGG